MFNDLFDAIQVNDTKKIENLLQNGLDVSHPLEGDFTPLISAILCGAGDAFKLLYEHGAPLNTIGHGDRTALDVWAEFKDERDPRQMRIIIDVLRAGNAQTAKTMHVLDESLKRAIQKQDKKQYEELLQKGARLDCSINEKDNALILAYQTKNTRFFKRVLEDVTEGDINSPAICSFLDYLVTHNEIKGIKDFVKMGGDIRFQDETGDTLLLKAVRSGQSEMAQTLLALGADLNEPDQVGLLPLDVAFLQNDGDMFVTLLKSFDRKNIDTPRLQEYVLKAIDEGYDRIIESLVAAKVNLTPNADATLLHKALQPVKTNYVEKLTAKEDVIGKRPDEVIKDGRLRIAECLIEAGANVNQKDSEGNTALLLAVKNGYSALIDPLLDKKVDIEEVNNDEMSALKLAICYATAKDVDLLVLRGANVNAAGENGYTSLMRAALRNDTDMIRILIENGANVNAQSKLGDTALLMAAENGNWPAIKCLLEHRADKEIKNNNGDDFILTLGRSFSMLKNSYVPEVLAFLEAERAKQPKVPFLKRVANAWRGK
ncbi:MAG: ankyrin repeat domain-containing protein [Alphaproteobacteria bacterium]|nr:ankyrin repeat domain-containing protein [Alphaproteobacteria bacterium]